MDELSRRVGAIMDRGGVKESGRGVEDRGSRPDRHRTQNQSPQRFWYSYSDLRDTGVGELGGDPHSALRL
jgi:hypothetical protein